MQHYTETDSPLIEEIFAVKDLNNLVKSMLEANFSKIWVKGEISNLAQPRSGHLYFTLKDESAQIRCAMFKGQQRGINFNIKDGIEVLVEGTLSLYTDRGDYQLIASKMNLWGEGQLQQAYEALKLKLQTLGWFEQSHKKAIPRFPKHIGIISSPTGDALQDILRMLKQRYPIAPITLYPTQVQGKKCAAEIAKAIRLANSHQQADVLILARGGGSLEDLWGFNEEIVAKAIFESTIPLVTGIGHEMDFSIADFVADLRAPTPTAAAQFITPDQQELIAALEEKERSLIRAMQRMIDFSYMKLDGVEKRLVHPKNKIENNIEKLKHYTRHLQHALQACLQQAQSKVNTLDRALLHHAPTRLIQALLEKIANQEKSMRYLIQHQISQKEKQMAQYCELLNSLSPLTTMKRGFSITADEHNKNIHSIKDLHPDQIIITKVNDGKIKSKIITLIND